MNITIPYDNIKYFANCIYILLLNRKPYADEIDKIKIQASNNCVDFNKLVTNILKSSERENLILNTPLYKSNISEADFELTLKFAKSYNFDLSNLAILIIEYLISAGVHPGAIRIYKLMNNYEYNTQNIRWCNKNSVQLA